MTEPLDILDERDPITGPLFASLFIHGAVVAALFFGWFWIKHKADTLGDVNPSGGPAYAVSPVHNIPIPQRDAPINPVAHDTESAVPSAPAKQETEKQIPLIPPKDAFEIPDKIKHQAEKPHPQQQYTPPAPPNQVYSSSKEAMSNPMYGVQSGAGKVGIGPNSPLGNRLGWYAQLIRDRLAQNWQTSGLDIRSQSAPAVVSFHILRDGSVKDPEIIQSSGNPTIDNTALRAVYSANPLPPLPPQIAENDISAQFTFNLR